MSKPQIALQKHLADLKACTICPKMHRPSVSGGPVVSRVITIGQAPGSKEPLLGKPFAWTAGKTLFQWFERASSLSESAARSSIYMAAVCRCFPGKSPTGGDRVPSPPEIAHCSKWLAAEFAILQPSLVIPIGKLAIQQFLPFNKLTEVIGRSFPMKWASHPFSLIPLPHPSGASPGHRTEPGKSLLHQALAKIASHPDWPSSSKNLPT